MHVHKDHLRLPPQGMRAQHRIHRRERIVEGAFHEHLAQHLKHKDLAPARIAVKPMSAPRCLFGKIQWSQDARLIFDEGQHVLLVESVVAEGQAIDA